MSISLLCISRSSYEDIVSRLRALGQEYVRDHVKLAPGGQTAIVFGDVGLVPDGNHSADVVQAIRRASLIAENFGLSRPLVDRQPTLLILGRWEGEQAASAEISRRILRMLEE